MTASLLCRSGLPGSSSEPSIVQFFGQIIPAHVGHQLEYVRFFLVMTWMKCLSDPAGYGEGAKTSAQRCKGSGSPNDLDLKCICLIQEALKSFGAPIRRAS